jgi:hypothetical protein
LGKWYVNRQQEKKLAAHTAKLVDAIYKEKQLFSEFDFELKEITSTFDFQLQLKNGIRCQFHQLLPQSAFCKNNVK